MEKKLITDQPNEGGFYIHTSDGILKWLDLCEDFGGSALIQVKLGGKQIKSNAAISENGDHMYVLTNNPIEVPIKVINHGAEGVRNVKVNYVITGQVYEQRGVQDGGGLRQQVFHHPGYDARCIESGTGYFCYFSRNGSGQELCVYHHSR